MAGLGASSLLGLTYPVYHSSLIHAADLPPPPMPLFGLYWKSPSSIKLPMAVVGPTKHQFRRLSRTDLKVLCRCILTAAATETNASGDLAPQRDAFQMLADNLATEALPEVYLERLKLLVAGLHDPWLGEHRALTFLQAGGLPVIIRHLRGSAAAGAVIHVNALSCSISSNAATALTTLLNRDTATLAELSVATDMMPPLIDALSIAPDWTARSAAAHALLQIAKAHPAQQKAMADAGLFELVTAFYTRLGASLFVGASLMHIVNMLDPAAALVRVLLSSGTTAVRDLRRAICGPDVHEAFAALVILQVCHPCRDFII